MDANCRKTPTKKKSTVKRYLIDQIPLFYALNRLLFDKQFIQNMSLIYFFVNVLCDEASYRVC